VTTFDRPLCSTSGVRVKRREFVGLAVGAGVGLPLAAWAQPRDKMRRLGVLMGSLASDGEGQKRAAALAQGLDALNWRDGGNLSIDWRWAGGDPALFQRYAGEMVALGPEVLLAEASPSVEALRQQTSTIPIVFLIVTDPVGQGFVESLARPRGNITGFSNYDSPMAGKWLGLLREITPPVARLAVLYNPATAPYAGLYLRTIEDIALAVAVAVQTAPVKDDAEIEAVMARLTGEQGAGLLVLPDTFTRLHRDAIVALAARYRLPAVYPFRYFAASGGLMSYGIEIEDLFRRSAGYVDRLLKGAKASELPVQNPTKFALVINLKTAKALGVTVPLTLLGSADEVIE
jgi:putative tryptophan/tyrosine transport system substrate-binding protein